MAFEDFDICYRMASLRKYYFVTLTYILDFKSKLWDIRLFIFECYLRAKIMKKINNTHSNAFKNTTITPLLKKTGLDINDLKNFRPVSNVSFLSKILEKVVHGRMVAHLEATDAMHRTRSAYYRHHSTAIALLKVFNDINTAIDSGHVPAGPIGNIRYCWPLYPARSVGENIRLYRPDNWIASYISWEPIFSSLLYEPILITGVAKVRCSSGIHPESSVVHYLHGRSRGCC